MFSMSVRPLAPPPNLKPEFFLIKVRKPENQIYHFDMSGILTTDHKVMRTKNLLTVKRKSPTKSIRFVVTTNYSLDVTTWTRSPRDHHPHHHHHQQQYCT